ncbi:RNB domain-containing ribonuclease [Streptomyces sp. NBC_00083]|uniref:RNB domain-containing ribonuclease n=1 Tax=Streptomyces sp. NBC_00083 TaxID=2975647 RepID=UPI00225231FB|nr:RNB domain-containing ribonuclease [Streptomyces sp. NBC_00083]MCX5382764.1 RNB domain-containing ribonuclease [Streptomyces sp. NBC_00083]
MPRRHLHLQAAAEAPLRAAFDTLRASLDVPAAFPDDVTAEAQRAAAEAQRAATEAPRAAAEAPRTATEAPAPSYDATGIALFTIDPPTSTDLDQAMYLERRAGGGYRVYYAIADVAAFVAPGGALDAEAHRRVTTLYFPDGKTPLHPTVLSEGAASLLPGATRPALLWQIDLDADGATTAADVRRALVRSRAKLDYEGVQKQIDAGTAPESLALLRDIGTLREQQEVARGGISLNVPEQEIVETGHGYGLTYRAPLPADGWNAQISLLTGIAGAQLMLTYGTGILRTLPSAPDGAVARLRRSAKALGIDWPHHVPYAAVVRSLDPREPNHAAFLQECTSLLRGAGYTVFTGGTAPELAVHAAVAAPYTHCTAPLRRLVDRYAGELCLAAVAGQDPPEWVTAALDALPKEMAQGTSRANTVERESVDIVEAALLKDRVGEVFDATVVDVREQQPTVGTVHLTDPAVVARVEGGGDLPLGERLRVRLTQADPGTAKVLFAPA